MAIMTKSNEWFISVGESTLTFYQETYDKVILFIFLTNIFSTDSSWTNIESTAIWKSHGIMSLDHFHSLCSYSPSLF